MNYNFGLTKKYFACQVELVETSLWVYINLRQAQADT